MQNTIYTGDNLHFLYRMDSGTVDLIYLDPPFNSKRMYSAPVGSKAAGTSFKDMWSWSDIDEQLLETVYTEHPCLADYINTIEGLHGKPMKSYILYMAMRIKEMHRILKETGSLYLHVDPTASHYLKLVLDKIFGEDNFRNEIVWHYGSWTNAAKFFQRNHDVILFYSKGNDYTFHRQFIPRQNPAPYNIQGGKVNQMLIYRPEETPEEVIEKQKKKGRKIIVVGEKGMNEHDVWTYLRDRKFDQIQPRSKERTGYPTQKPLQILYRIIKASTNEGDVVMDPFCGCATTCVAAQQLNRKWIGIDIEEKSVDVLIERLADDAGMFRDFISTDILPERTDIEIVEESPDVKQELYAKQNELCNGCKNAYLIKDLEIDHIIPKSKGGSDTRGNYQLLCGNCNRRKSNNPMSYLMAKLAADAKIKQSVTYGKAEADEESTAGTGNPEKDA